MVVQNGDLPWYFEQRITKKTNQSLLLMEEILHHLDWLKSYKYWDNHHPWWLAGLCASTVAFQLPIPR